ncbi:MAG: transporter substrate-binding domain-containing protein [Bacilli bacterium]|nr:transporter substrate-binding domain-containing protein [Bacilli bacterium]
MSKKSKIILGVIILFSVVIGLLYFFMNEDNNTSLTVSQKKWIENNKNSVIDLAVLGGIPVLNENGNGLFLEFISSLEKETGLEFNELSYTKGEKAVSDYSLEVSDNTNNGILFYRDNYVIVTKKKIYFNDVTEVSNLKIGVLKGASADINNYLYGSNNLVFTGYDDIPSMFTDLNGDLVDGIVVPKLDYLKTILEYDLNIAYNIDEYPINYVFKFGDNEKLNKILIKYFDGYKKKKFDKAFNKYLANAYFTYEKIDEKEQASFRSKRYSYGFVYDEPYMMNVKGNLVGFNYSFIKKFANAANIEVDFKRYSSKEKLYNDFNTNKLDFIYGDLSVGKYKIKTYSTDPIYNNKVTLITKGRTDLTVNNISSLNDATVMVVKDSSAHKFLKKNGIRTKTYETTSSLVNSLSGDKVALVDSYVYDYFVRNNLKDAIKLKTIDIQSDFGFVSRNIKENEIFNRLMDFYISFVSSNKIVNEGYKKIFSSNNNLMMLQVTLSILVIILIGIIIFLLFYLLKKRGKYDNKLSKADKLRYADSMTSLKNRDYLNDNISRWDESKVYPQAIIIIDLNNIAYINDNFGHAEGDKVIVEAAGVLIKNQMSDSELIRTNGNEFLVFTIGHEEKDVVTYIRRLNKEFKELSHGFGAAIGYSMINDEIKTVDDAVNEATIDMRRNKEEVN